MCVHGIIKRWQTKLRKLKNENSSYENVGVNTTYTTAFDDNWQYSLNKTVCFELLLSATLKCELRSTAYSYV